MRSQTLHGRYHVLIMLIEQTEVLKKTMAIFAVRACSHVESRFEQLIAKKMQSQSLFELLWIQIYGSVAFLSTTLIDLKKELSSLGMMLQSIPMTQRSQFGAFSVRPSCTGQRKLDDVF